MEFFRQDHRRRVEEACQRFGLPEESLAWQIFRRAAKEWWRYREMCFRDTGYYWDRLCGAVQEAWKQVLAARGNVRSPGGLLYWLTFEGRKQDGRSLLTAWCNLGEEVPDVGLEPGLRNARKLLRDEAKDRRRSLDRSRDLLRAACLREKVERGRKGRRATRAQRGKAQIEEALGARVEPAASGGGED